MMVSLLHLARRTPFTPCLLVPVVSGIGRRLTFPSAFRDIPDLPRLAVDPPSGSVVVVSFTVNKYGPESAPMLGLNVHSVIVLASPESHDSLCGWQADPEAADEFADLDGDDLECSSCFLRNMLAVLTPVLTDDDGPVASSSKLCDSSTFFDLDASSDSDAGHVNASASSSSVLEGASNDCDLSDIDGYKASFIDDRSDPSVYGCSDDDILDDA
jgi:hypothetical protein